MVRLRLMKVFEKSVHFSIVTLKRCSKTYWTINTKKREKMRKKHKSFMSHIHLWFERIYLFSFLRCSEDKKNTHKKRKHWCLLNIDENSFRGLWVLQWETSEKNTNNDKLMFSGKWTSKISYLEVVLLKFHTSKS